MGGRSFPRKASQRTTLTLEKLLSRTVLSGVDCFEWRGTTMVPSRANRHSYPYGVLYVRGIRWIAHRYAYTLAYGAIPDGMCVCHRCDNPRCINPEHLFLGSMGDNNRDRHLKGRSNAPRGEGHGCHKLTDDQVRLVLGSPLTGRELAKQLQVAEPTISRIRSGRGWKHLLPAKESAA